MKNSKKKVRVSSAYQVKCGAVIGSVITIAVIVGLVAILSGFVCALWHFGYMIAYVGLGAIVGYILNRVSKKTLVVEEKDDEEKKCAPKNPRKEYKKK
mgnify:CR=1 FL=1